jgi:hypothetical protein
MFPSSNTGLWDWLPYSPRVSLSVSDVIRDARSARRVSRTTCECQKVRHASLPDDRCGSALEQTEGPALGAIALPVRRKGTAASNVKGTRKSRSSLSLPRSHHRVRIHRSRPLDPERRSHRPLFDGDTADAGIESHYPTLRRQPAVHHALLSRLNQELGLSRRVGRSFYGSSKMGSAPCPLAFMSRNHSTTSARRFASSTVSVVDRSIPFTRTSL